MIRDYRQPRRRGAVVVRRPMRIMEAGGAKRILSSAAAPSLHHQHNISLRSHSHSGNMRTNLCRAPDWPTPSFRRYYPPGLAPMPIKTPSSWASPRYELGGSTVARGNPEVPSSLWAQRACAVWWMDTPATSSTWHIVSLLMIRSRLPALYNRR